MLIACGMLDGASRQMKAGLSTTLQRPHQLLKLGSFRRSATKMTDGAAEPGAQQAGHFRLYDDPAMELPESQSMELPESQPVEKSTPDL